MVSDLTKGTIDAAWGIPEAEFTRLQSVKGIKAVAYNFFTWDYLSMNCYTGTSSGNPVLRDWRFRYALNYAVDRQRLCDLAYQGYARVGTTILPPNEWSNPDYHWQPPASALYTFDLAKAGRLLDQAGYPRGPGGWRLFKGKPISLRLWAPTDSSEEQAAAKLITGWFTQLGLKITFSVMDTGALYSHIYNYQGNDLAPDFDMYVWDWIGFADPGQTLSSMTARGFGNSNEPGWSNAAYNRLNDLELTALDPQKRKAVIWRIQQVMYEQTPWLVLVYPDQLEAYNTDKWAGWTRTQNGHGPAFYTGVGNDTYLNLRPTTTGTSGTGGGATGVLAIVVGIVVVAGMALLLARRRRGRRRIEGS
jgi:peptide/nickel transport system substrate-binding protein